MRVAVLGAGPIGAAVALLLCRRDDVVPHVLDVDHARASRAVEAAGRGTADAIDVTAHDAARALDGCDAVLACLPYRMNLYAMEAALAARIPYADLGGLYHMTLRQLQLHDAFARAGVPAIAGIGACPGITNLLARAAADRLGGAVTEIEMADGAIDEADEFAVLYSADTMLDEFLLPAVVFEDGELREVPAASGRTDIAFPEPVGAQPGFYTLHSELATLPRTIAGIRTVRWRLALPPMIEAGFRAIVALGLASTEPIETETGPVTPRSLLIRLLARLPAPTGPPRDVEAMIVEASGPAGRARAEALFRPTREGLSAGAFGTAMPIALCASWLAEGSIPPGVHPPEAGIDAERFLAELVSEGVELSWK